jgi:hypothetical protein
LLADCSQAKRLVGFSEVALWVAVVAVDLLDRLANRDTLGREHRKHRFVTRHSEFLLNFVGHG